MSGIRPFCRLATACLMAAALAGCGSSTPYQKLLQSDKPLDRAHGCIAAAEKGDTSAVPLLVDRLEDTDEAVRMVADRALRQLTGQDFHYRESDPADKKAEAVRQWRAYARTLGRGGG